MLVSKVLHKIRSSSLQTTSDHGIWLSALRLVTTANVHLMITEFTLAEVRDLLHEEGEGQHGGLGHVLVRRLDEVKVKGKQKPVVVYELVNIKDGAPTDAIVVDA